MSSDPGSCYRALLARDARFDGRFFVAVRTTGVYCRPVCPAPTPRFENCLFVPCAAAAQELGYRPCLRCRPEVSPGTPAWQGSSATVSRALRLISAGALRDGRVDALAARLGVGERQLRRLFVKHLGAPPLAVEQTRRILFAKKLIDETRLSMTEVALSSGFASVRRFNDAIRGTYARTPSELRRSSRGRARTNESSAPGRSDEAHAAPGRELCLRLAYRPPYDWAAILRYLAVRATPAVEVVDGDSYWRSVRVGEAIGSVEVRALPGQSCLVARIRLSSTAPLIQVNERLRRSFDLDADPEQIRAHLQGDPRLRELMRRRTVARVPGAWDGFELAVRAILGQQVSVRGATTLAGRLAQQYGEPLATGDAELSRLFPTPEALRDADLGSVGLPSARAAAIRGLARAVASGELVLDASLGLSDTVARLRALPGIGEWTAQYIAMRALREPDAFPSGDLGLRRALGNGSGPISDRELLAAAEAWRPWRAYAAMHLWLADAPASPD